MTAGVPAAPKDPHLREVDAVAAALGVDPARGLATGDVPARRARFGPNEIARGVFPGPLRILANQLRGAIFWLLVVAAGLSLWMGDRAEGVAVAVVLALNTVIGFIIEFRAIRSMDALHALTRTTARVLRDGRSGVVDAADIVPGDVVELEAGDLVPADLRLTEARDLQLDEAPLTGESAPVRKDVAALEREAPLAERSDMAWRGTSVTRGRGRGVAVATGMATQIGDIAGLVAETGDRRSPLERRLQDLGRTLAWAAVVAVLVLAGIGILAGRDPMETLRVSVALAVAAVPEGLPVVATLALARGMWRMARRNVLVNRLSSIETLGSVGMILTDKTGTLTCNEMVVEAVLLPRDGALVEIAPGAGEAAGTLRAAALCTDTGRGGGDPMEIALVAAAEAAGMPLDGLLGEWPRLRLIPFDPESQLMASIHRGPDDPVAAVKGAPESVLAASTWIATPDGVRPLPAEEREALATEVSAAAGRGLRLLGVARRTLAGQGDDPVADLTLLGFVGLADPPRDDVRAAIAACRDAGLRVVMITGDHPATATRIARDVGLADTPRAVMAPAGPISDLDAGARSDLLAADVLARVAPRAKLELVALHQDAGAVVAMIGDGVNDAPALKAADIGIAMGKRGTQVAAEASDLILRDDRMASIVAAIHEGRVIYGNIRAFVRYLFSCNLSEMLVVGLALLAGLPLPLLPLQILFLNLITDVFPALALGAGEGPRDVMKRPPRPAGEPLIGRAAWIRIAVEASLIAAATLAVHLAALSGVGGLAPTTAAFLTLALAQLWHVFAIHAPQERFWRSQVTRNRWVWGAIALSFALILLGLYVPPLADALALERPDAVGWAVILAASLAPGAALGALRVAVPALR